MTRGESLASTVPTPEAVVRRMLEVADVKPGERVYDLGSGDGRIPIIAAREFGALGFGVELNERLVWEVREKVKAFGLENRAELIHGDIFQVDLREADVVTMYLTTKGNEKVRPKLEEELRAGARVVTHTFPIAKWGFGKETMFRQGNTDRFIYLYIWPGKEYE